LVILIDSLKTGGAQRLISAFVSSANDYQIDPVVISLDEDPSPAIYEAIQTSGTKLIAMPAHSLFSIRRLKQLVDYLKTEKIDVLHTHLLYANIIGSVAGYLAKVPVVCTLHSTHIEKRWRKQKRVEDFCLRHFATRIIAVGNMVATAHRGRYKGRTLDVIPNGIAEPESIPSQTLSRVRDELGVNGHPIVITVGRLERVKGYGDMIEAFMLLRQKDSNSILLMVGSGSQQNSLRSQIEALDLERCVILAGERQDIPQLLATSDVFASSSHREGLPLSVLEAMMAGLPIVATSVGDIPNVVTKETGVVVPPHRPELLAEALDDLLKNPAKRRQMGKAAKDRAMQEYSLDVWMRRQVQLYKDVLRSTEPQVL
jgi:glycosyltransferase involved in cell wall biosynthesis